MSKDRTGTVVYVPAKPGETQGHYKARVTCNDGSRPWIHFEAGPKSPQAEARAREKAAHRSEQFSTQGIVAVPQRRARKVRQASAADGETFELYVKRWLADRERRGLSSVMSDRGRLKQHVYPVLEGKPVATIGREDVRAVVEHLDDVVRAGTISWRTAVKAWGIVTKLFSDACESKSAALRLRGDNPTAGVRGPDRGEYKGKQWLYPSEVAALIAYEGGDGAPGVPLRWRRLYALAAYLYLRPGELAALEWKDVQLEHGYVHVHQALDIRTGRVKPTKTGITRKVPIRPTLRPLLVAMSKEMNAKGRVVQHTHDNQGEGHAHGMPPLEDLAATLRVHLLRAGVTRSDLHDEQSTTKRVTFYDLRATGITWEVLDSTEHVRIMQRAGHRNFSTTQGYIREAEAVGLDIGAPFPTLPATLLKSRESSTAEAIKSSQQSSQARARSRSSTIFTGLSASPRGFAQW
jgi:integrase